MLYVSGADLNALTDALNKQQTLYIVSYGSFSGTQIGVSKAQGSTAALIVERCSLRPQDGYHPFDFVMDDPGPGKVIGAHLGHAIIGNTIKY